MGKGEDELGVENLPHACYRLLKNRGLSLSVHFDMILPATLASATCGRQPNISPWPQRTSRWRVSSLWGSTCSSRCGPSTIGGTGRASALPRTGEDRQSPGLNVRAPNHRLQRTPSSVRSCVAWSSHPSTQMHGYRPDTVGQSPSTEIGVPNMPALKAKKLSELPREKVLLELWGGLANSIRPLSTHTINRLILAPDPAQKLSPQSALLRSMRKDRRRVNKVHQDRWYILYTPGLSLLAWLEDPEKGRGV